MAGSEAAALQALLSSVKKAFTAVGKNGAHQTKDRSEEVLAALDGLVNKKVLVGVPEDKAERKEESELNNAARAYILNYGAPEAHIPARPFMEPGIKAAKDKINLYFRGVATSALAGNQSGVDKNLNGAGDVARDSIKTVIASNVPPPLAARTIADRKEKGRQSEKTLVETGEMRNAISYVVESR